MRQVNEAEYTSKLGVYFHPDIPKEFDHDSLTQWGEENGIQVTGVWMESTCKDKELFFEVFDKGCLDISLWKPRVPHGATLIAKFHDEDGPYAYFGKKVEDETCQS